MRNIGLNLVEKCRENSKDVMEFFNANNQNSSDLLKDVKIYSLLSNRTITTRFSTKFYALNLWVVYLYEIFSYDNYQSKINTYLDTL